MMSVQNVPMRITSLRKEAKRDLAAFAPKMHQRAGLGANFRGSCNCIILDMATEPSCGVGNFFGMLPEEMRGSKLYGVELDLSLIHI